MSNIAHIVTKRKAATDPIFTRFIAVFYLFNCQKWGRKLQKYVKHKTLDEMLQEWF